MVRSRNDGWSEFQSNIQKVRIQIPSCNPRSDAVAARWYNEHYAFNGDVLKSRLFGTDLAVMKICFLSDAAEPESPGWQRCIRQNPGPRLRETLAASASFELAMKQLGGKAVYLSRRSRPGQARDHRRCRRYLSRYVDAIAVRTFAQSTLEELAQWAGVPVINALSDAEHPCQAWPTLTVYEHKGNFRPEAGLHRRRQQRRRDPGLAAASVGLNFTIATPRVTTCPRQR